MSREHQIMIIQGSNNAIFTLRDKGQVSTKSASGTWKDRASKTSDEEEVAIVGSDKYPKVWKFTSEAPGVLVMGTEGDQSKSSQKEGEGKYIQEYVKLNGISRDSAGRFAVANGDEEGQGSLTYNASRLLKKGAIKWAVVRYER
jgi:hypothetical protein